MRIAAHTVTRHVPWFLGLLILAQAAPARAQQPNREDFIVRSSATMLQDMLRDRQWGVPPALLSQSEGVILFPRMIQVGFIGGARHGRGLVVMRDEATGQWSNPFFVTLTGGNVGLQIGASSTELVLVFRDRATIERFLLGQGKMTFGVDATLAAGPMGAGMGGETDPRFKADIMTYSRGRGLYAGAVMGGSVATVDHRANWAYYNAPVTAAEILANANEDMVVPASAEQLRQVLSLANVAPGRRRPGANQPPAGEVPPEAGDPVIIDPETDGPRFP